MSKPPRILLIFLFLIFSFSGTVQAQNPIVTLSVQAGFDGLFRDSEWTPVIIQAANDGDDISGRLVVRPETSGTGITNTYSTPVTLPSGARQTVFLYITARSFASQIRVELLDDAGGVVAQQEAGLRAIQPQDRLNVVITNSPVGAVDLTGARAGNFNGFQAALAISDLPTQALSAVDLLLISDVDSGGLSSAQRQALEDWIAAGGHLIVTGGQNWQATAAGVAALLPLTPDGSREIDGLQPLAHWLRDASPLDDATIIATGTLREDAEVLVAAEDGTPLLARRTFGAGKIDYLAADPNNAPLRGWNSLPALWYALVTSGSPQPGWANGFVDWEAAARAAEILPGYDPLPDILPLFGFLVLYILLIGPLNYIILSRINRREWAWFTIPAFILLFSVLAYALGFNLRGNVALLNRIAFVQSWHDSSRASVDQLVGLLSPRRAQYSLSSEGSDSLRPIPRPLQATGLLTRNAQSSIDVRESEPFEAYQFNVDASFIAGFHLSGMIDKPAISGQATIADDMIAGQQVVRGSVRNDSTLTLTDPVILARGVALHLDQPLAPGEIATFDLTLPGDNPPPPILRLPFSVTSLFSSRSTESAIKASVIDILSPDKYTSNITRLPFSDSFDAQVNRRRQYFLSSLINDYYNAGGRGDHVYFAGWTDSTPFATDVTGAGWNAQDTSIYLFELDSERIIPSAGSVTISPDQFTWVVEQYAGINDVTPVSFQMQPGEEVVFRYTPLPAAVLRETETLSVFVENLNTGGRNTPVSLWNWETRAWEPLNVLNETATIDAPAPYLGPNNAVQVRLLADEIGGFVRIGRVSVAQTGTF